MTETMSEPPVPETKSCRNCAAFWFNGSGYSDWTWLETYAICGLNKNVALRDFSADTEKDYPEYGFANECKHFERSYELEAVVISPDGCLESGDQRVGLLIRALTRG